MSQGVSRLKELLFDNESEALRELRDRLDVLDHSHRIGRAEIAASLARQTEADATARTVLEARMASVLDARVAAALEAGRRGDEDLARVVQPALDRAGSDDRFRRNVAGVLDAALREAEATRHRELSQAMAPLVVRTIKTEIRNSQDEMVEVLYPITGRMVRAYLAAAMKDLVQQINRRLEQNPLMLRLRSLTTGRSVAELALADTARLEVADLLLVRRGTGELISRWPQSPAGSNSDHVLGGTLAAINEFAAEAFKGEGTALRHVDLGSSQVYLRASQTHLLAARCLGTAPAAIEQILDDELVTAVASLQGTDVATGGAVPALAETARRLTERVAERQAEMAVPSGNPLKVVAILVAVPVLLWLGWWLWSDYRANHVLSTAKSVVAATPELTGYPLAFDLEWPDRAIVVRGLTPTPEVRDVVLGRLAAALPGTEVRERLSVVPGGTSDAERRIGVVERELTGLESGVRRDITGLGDGVRRDLSMLAADVSRRIGHEFERAALARDAARAASRLEGVRADLQRFGSDTVVPAGAPAGGGGQASSALAAVASTAAEASRALADLAVRAGPEAVPSDAVQRAAVAPADPATLRAAADAWTRRIAAQADELAERMAGPAGGGGTGPSATASPTRGDLVAEVERLASLVLAYGQLDALRRQLPAQRLPTVEERLEAFVRRNAIFFANNSDFRDPTQAEATIDALADLMRQSGVLIRVAGYTDERGGQARNVPLAQARADKVADSLVARGIPRDRVVSVGRINSRDVSPATGPDSPNRRVEFEIGFIGEGAR